MLNSELKRTQNGLWVDPDDQSTWLYHSWLLGETFSLSQQDDIKPILAPTSNGERILVLQGEIRLLEDLLEEVPDSKCKSTSHHGLTGRVPQLAISIQNSSRKTPTERSAR